MLQLESIPDSANPLRVLCLGAHSDDIEIGCGASLLALMEANRAVNMRWIVFSGDSIRHAEAKSSFDSWTSHTETCRLDRYDFRDGFFPDQWAAIKEGLIILKETFEPDLIFTHTREDLHQDHRVIHEITCNCFRHHLVFEYEIPKYDGDLGRPNLFIPVTEDQAREKVTRLMRYFTSQHSKHWFSEELFMGLMRLRGMEAASATGYAEGFHCRKACLSIN